jgi:hypothetical protein
VARKNPCADIVESLAEDGARTPLSPSSNAGRDRAGKFTKGNGGGPGNPFARRVAELRRAALSATTPEKIAAVMSQLEAKALQGDAAAAKLYLSYTLGRPAATVDPDSVHVQEALLLQKEVGLLEMVTRSVMKPLLETLLVIVRTSRPEISEEFVQGLLAGFAAQDEAERAAAAARAHEPTAATDSARACPEAPSTPSTNRPNGASAEATAGPHQSSGPARSGRPSDSPPMSAPETIGENGLPIEGAGSKGSGSAPEIGCHRGKTAGATACRAGFESVRRPSRRMLFIRQELWVPLRNSRFLR